MTMDHRFSQHTTEVQIEVFDTAETLADRIAEKLLQALDDTVGSASLAHVSLTGGIGIAVLRAAAELIRQGSVPVPNWRQVHFWWGDERLLPTGDPDRNETQARNALLDLLAEEHGLPRGNIHPMPCSEEAANPEAAAQMYARELERYAPAGGINGLAVPPLAVMLLGVGPDGHIHSLFPGKESLRATGQATTGEENAPESLGPPLRVTLTLDAVHSARRVWTAAAGDNKAEAAVRALAADAEVDQVPAAAARGAQETIWHLDRLAASGLP